MNILPTTRQICDNYISIIYYTYTHIGNLYRLFVDYSPSAIECD